MGRGMTSRVTATLAALALATTGMVHTAAAPPLSWALAGSGRGIVQTKFQILVATSPSLLHLGRADMWAATAHGSDPFARYAGRALAPRTRYYWTVRVWVHGGPPTDWSPPTWFETAYLGAGDWRGSWIAGPERITRPL